MHNCCHESKRCAEVCSGCPGVLTSCARVLQGCAGAGQQGCCRPCCRQSLGGQARLQETTAQHSAAQPSLYGVLAAEDACFKPSNMTRPDRCPHLPGSPLPSPTAALLTVAACHWRSPCLQDLWALRLRHPGSGHPACSKGHSVSWVCASPSPLLFCSRARTCWLPCCCCCCFCCSFLSLLRASSNCRSGGSSTRKRGWLGGVWDSTPTTEEPD